MNLGEFTMLDNFIDAYYKQKGIKGYEVIGKKLTTLFITIIVAIVVVLITSFLLSNWWVLLILVLLFISMFIVNTKIDAILKNYRKRNVSEIKTFILNYLIITLRFNHSNQYKEFAFQLQQKGEKSIKSYNLIPQLTIILTVILFLGTLIVQVYPKYLIGILAFSIIITLIVLYINPLVNEFVSLFRNGKPEKMIELAYIINEIYLEELIKENTAQVQNSKSLRKGKRRS